MTIGIVVRWYVKDGPSERGDHYTSFFKYGRNFPTRFSTNDYLNLKIEYKNINIESLKRTEKLEQYHSYILRYKSTGRLNVVTYTEPKYHCYSILLDSYDLFEMFDAEDNKIGIMKELMEN